MPTYSVSHSFTGRNFSLCQFAAFGQMEGEFDEDELNPALSPGRRREVAENIVGEVDWFEGLRGHCLCPGDDQHTTLTAYKHCRILLDGVPTIQCFHTSCEAAVAAKNRELRRRLPALSSDKVLRSERQPKKRLREIEVRSADALETILAAFVHPNTGVAIDLASCSPIPVPTSDAAEQTRLFLRTLFLPNDVLWIGQKHHSGQPRHRKNFRTAAQWLGCRVHAGEFTCPNTFKPGSQSRGGAAIEQRRYVVVESDELSHIEMAAVLRWLQTRPGWRLRAVVYSGNKSLHGWFDGAPLAWPLEELAAFICGLRCDPATLRPSQPVRLPGALRADTQKYQSLLYLSPSNH